MHSRYLIKRILAVAGSVLILTIACRDKDVETFPKTFAVDIIGSDDIYPDAWVIVGNADAATVLAARRVTGEGLMDFGDTGADRISVSIAYRSGYHNGYRDIHVDSYLNVYGGTWTWVRGSRPTIGTATVTLHFPPGYNSYSVAIPSARRAKGDTIAYTDTLWTETIDVQQLESEDRLSVYAMVWNMSGSSLSGWIVNQPFQRDQDNTYDVYLTEPIPSNYIVCSRPVDHIWMDGYRSPACIQYPLTWPRHYDMSGWADFDFIVPAFPVDKRCLTIYGSEGNEGYHAEICGQEIPSSLVIAPYVTTASYDAETSQIGNIQFSGAADAVVGMYMLNYEGVYNNSWIIHAPPGTASIGLPVLPDSIAAAIPFDRNSLWAVVCSARDYNTVFDYDGYVDLLCRSATGVACQYDLLYESRRLLQGSWEPPY